MSGPPPSRLTDASGNPVGDRRVTDSSGTTFIPATRRADGTWRKEIKVRAGYVPVEEVSAYVPRAAREVQARTGGLPIGMDPVPTTCKPVVKGRGAVQAGTGAKLASETTESASARKNARRKEKRAEARKAAEEEKLAERLAEASLTHTDDVKPTPTTSTTTTTTTK